MWYIVIVLFLIAGFTFGTKFIINQPKTNNGISNKNIVLNSPLEINDTIKAMFSKKQIDLKLKRLAKTPVPKNLFFGALCYDRVAIDSSVYEYICPSCGEKTIYKNTDGKEKFQYIDGILWEIDACRREIEKVKGINIKLDEKQFCSHCNPKIDHPVSYLLVNIAGQSDTTKISNFNYMDIRMIQEFLEDKLIHKTSNDGETALVENISRIRELLGLK